jgi:hypothetical protein
MVLESRSSSACIPASLSLIHIPRERALAQPRVSPLLGKSFSLKATGFSQYINRKINLAWPLRDTFPNWPTAAKRGLPRITLPKRIIEKSISNVSAVAFLSWELAVPTRHPILEIGDLRTEPPAPPNRRRMRTAGTWIAQKNALKCAKTPFNAHKNPVKPFRFSSLSQTCTSPPRVPIRRLFA